MQGGGVQSTSLESSPHRLERHSCAIDCCIFACDNCLVITIEYRLALHAMTLMGSAAASETLIGGYICTIGGAAPLKNSLERTLIHVVFCDMQQVKVPKEIIEVI